MTTNEKNMLKDSLYNTSSDCARDDITRNYAKGVLVGIVSAHMSLLGLNFEEAVKAVCDVVNDCSWKKRNPVHIDCIPERWYAEFMLHITTDC